jgi:hypothetical protein
MIFFLSKKTPKRRGGSIMNNWFSTGDIAKDMLTFKNTVLNSKTGLANDPSLTPLPS